MECRRTSTPLSNFISPRMSKHSKIRIKLPKSLVNAIQKRGDHHNNKNTVRIVFTSPFAKYKSPEKSSSKSKEDCKNGSKLRLPKVHLPLLRLLAMKKSLKKLMGSDTEATGVHGVGKQESAGHLVRFLQKPMLANCKKLKMAMLYMRERKMKSTEKLEEDTDQEDSSGEYELCKKRILMGGKCRSGTIHYDQNGMLFHDRSIWLQQS